MVAPLLNSRSYWPNARRLLRNARYIARGRLRFAGGRLDRSALKSNGDSCHRGASAETFNHLATYGAGTIIGVRSPLSWQPGGISSRSADSRKNRPHPTYRAPGNHRVSPATTALRRSNHRPMGAVIPPSCACLRSGLSPGAFRSLTPPPHRDGRIAGIGTRTSRRWRIQGGVRGLRLPIPRTGPTHCPDQSGTARGPSRHNGDTGEAEPGCGQGGETGLTPVGSSPGHAVTLGRTAGIIAVTSRTAMTTLNARACPGLRSHRRMNDPKASHGKLPANPATRNTIANVVA